MIPIFTACCLLIIALNTQAETIFYDEYEDNRFEHLEEKELPENPVSLPGAEGGRLNLQEFQAENGDSPFRYFIDRNTLTTSDDGITHYLLVIRSRSGVDNTSYEGMRCGLRLYKVYAYGGPNGLKMLKKPAWRQIPLSGNNNYRNILYKDLLCNLSTGRPNSPETVFRAMAQGGRVESPLINQD
jgi:hypothetical protein